MVFDTDGLPVDWKPAFTGGPNWAPDDPRLLRTSLEIAACFLGPYSDEGDGSYTRETLVKEAARYHGRPYKGRKRALEEMLEGLCRGRWSLFQRLKDGRLRLR